MIIGGYDLRLVLENFKTDCFRSVEHVGISGSEIQSYLGEPILYKYENPAVFKVNKDFCIDGTPDFTVPE